MKKIFLILTAILLLPLFSSCIIITEDYDITFFNNGDRDITDWYVEDYDGENYAKSQNRFVPVPIDYKSTIKDLNKDYYRVVFSYRPYPDEYDYWCSDYTYLDEDVEYKVYQDRFYSRSINKPNESQFYLIDSKGNKLPLHKLTE